MFLLDSWVVRIFRAGVALVLLVSVFGALLRVSRGDVAGAVCEALISAFCLWAIGEMTDYEKWRDGFL